MNIDLSPIDRRKVKNLGEVLEMNNEVLGLMSRYLTVCPDFITKELIEGITGECEITLAEAYTSLLVAACPNLPVIRIHPIFPGIVICRQLI